MGQDHQASQNCQFPGTTRISRYQNDKLSWILLRQEMMEMVVAVMCNAPFRSPIYQRSVFYRPHALLIIQATVSEEWRHCGNLHTGWKCFLHEIPLTENLTPLKIGGEDHEISMSLHICVQSALITEAWQVEQSSDNIQNPLSVKHNSQCRSQLWCCTKPGVITGWWVVVQSSHMVKLLPPYAVWRSR